MGIAEGCCRVREMLIRDCCRPVEFVRVAVRDGTAIGRGVAGVMVYD